MFPRCMFVRSRWIYVSISDAVETDERVTLRGGKYYLALLFVCAMGFAAITLPNFLQGKTIVWEFDGYGLYLNFFILEGELIRSAVSDIPAGTFAGFSTYAFDAGYGADLLATTAGCFNDPFNLVSALCPVAYAEYLYEALIFVRFYLAALAFSLFCFKKGKRGIPVLIASLCYVLSGFVIFWAVMKHANFLNVAILLPLILLGAEKVFADEKPYVLIGFLSLSLFFSVYFSYMLILILLGYCLIKFFWSVAERSWRRFLLLLGKFVGIVLLACMIAAIVLVPEFLLLTSMGRVGLERADVFLQPFSYYVYLPLSLVGVPISAQGVFLGCFPVLCLLVFVAFRKRFDANEIRPWLIGLTVCFVGILLPFFGKAMNGFSYVSDRWMVAWAFCAAYVVCLVLPLLMEKRVMSSKRLLVAICIFGVMLIAAALYRKEWESLLACIVFAAIALVVALLARIQLRETVYGACWVVLIVLSISSVSFASFFLSEDGASSYAPAGKTAERFEGNPDLLLQNYASDQWRFSQPARYTFCNATLNAGIKGIDFYSSFYNQAIDDYRQELGLSDDNSNYRFVGSDSRSALEALAGARYFLASDAQQARVPEMYRKIGESGRYGVYESSSVLPLAFVYDGAVSRSECDALDPVEKQEAMLQGVVLDDTQSGATKGLALHSSSNPVKIVDSTGVEVSDGQIVALENGASVTFACEFESGVESYLCMSDLAFEPVNPYAAQASGSNAGIASSIKKTVRSLMWSPASRSAITVECEGFTRTLTLKTNAAKTYAGKTDWVVNLGSGPDGDARVTVSFQRRGVYRFSSMDIARQELQPIYDAVEKIKDNGEFGYTFGSDSVSVHADSVRKGDYLYISLPYSSGWSAELNGEPVDILKANIGFMAVSTRGTGEQNLVLRYETPGLKMGAIGTALGLVAFACLCMYLRRRSRRVKGEE